MAKISKIIRFKALLINAHMFSTSSPTLPTEIFIVYGCLRTGGIETLIVRMANFFISVGVRVSVCCTAGGELHSSLDSHVNVIIYEETSDLAQIFNALKYVACTGTATLIMSFDPISAARALMIETVLSKKYRKVTHFSGVFHPRAYFMTGERKDRIFLNYLIARAIGKDRLFFMNEECKATHAVQWNTTLSSCPILALPINSVDAMWQSSDKAAVRIVSVGRLVDFKTYNLGAATVVRSCLDRGVAVTWDIFGDGPLCSSIKAEIERLGVVGYVRLMGALDYKDFPASVAGYDLFIGGGTAALEAAMVGLPTICATVDEATRCYGYLHCLPFGNVGELLSNPPTVELAELIQGYSISSKSQRAFLSKQSRAMAEKYGMPKFAEAIMNMTLRSQAAPPMFIKRVIAELHRFATESCVAKTVRYIVSKKVRSA